MRQNITLRLHFLMNKVYKNYYSFNKIEKVKLMYGSMGYFVLLLRCLRIVLKSDCFKQKIFA